MPIQKSRYEVLSGGFPATLVTNNADSIIEPNETPYAVGLDADAEGYIAKGTIASGSARTRKTYTVGGSTYDWHYRRLWRVSGDEIIWGALGYNDVYYRHQRGCYEANQGLDAGDFLDGAIHPIGTGGLAFFHENSGGGYIIRNADNLNARFDISQYMQDLKISDRSHAVTVDGILFFTNSDGFFAATVDGSIQEVSLPIRGDALLPLEREI